MKMMGKDTKGTSRCSFSEDRVAGSGGVPFVKAPTSTSNETCPLADYSRSASTASTTSTTSSFGGFWGSSGL